MSDMKKFLIYLFLLTFFCPTCFVFAKEGSNSLVNSAKRITSPSADNPLIPHITSDNTPKKNTKEKAATVKKEAVPVFDDEELPKVSSLPSKKNKKSLVEEIKKTDTSDDDEDWEDDEENEKSGGLLKDTWVEKLGNSIANLGSDTSEEKDEDEDEDEDSLESLTKGSHEKRKSNVSVFDVSGVMLRMSLQQAESTLMKRGYKLLSQHFEIPNFIKWRYEEKCRDSGVVGYERLNSCVVKAAKEGNYQFVESARYAKKDSKEEIVIWLTSNFTNNKVYKIAYETGITNINKGSGEKIAYLRSVKVYEFWRRINQKYGTPDNKEDILWGLGENKPYMKAATGRLLLEDPMLRELDYTRMSREDQKFMNTNLYNF
ncbi:MAG: hypothetical protein J6Y53_05695 [Alphaproteobacteria bacterium]|nr:hypothetical protein [Alphaproteobacteria bacterium]